MKLLKKCHSRNTKGFHPGCCLVNGLGKRTLFDKGPQLGWNDIGWNNPEIQTPHLDELARNGVIMNQSYVQPICTPGQRIVLPHYRSEIQTPESAFHPFSGPINEYQACLETKHWKFRVMLTRTSAHGPLRPSSRKLRWAREPLTLKWAVGPLSLVYINNGHACQIYSPCYIRKREGELY
ncbi:hypothetical protein TNCV_1979151 [Trichonephila clavipes]|nr:hypothetical protein TNCV_1979151 [Trichonephila clavipes]